MPISTTRKGYWTAWKDGVKINRDGHSGNHTNFDEARETIDWHWENNGDGVYTIRQPDYEVDVSIAGGGIIVSVAAADETAPDAPTGVSLLGDTLSWTNGPESDIQDTRVYKSIVSSSSGFNLESTIGI